MKSANSINRNRILATWILWCSGAASPINWEPVFRWHRATLILLDYDSIWQDSTCQGQSRISGAQAAFTSTILPDIITIQNQHFWLALSVRNGGSQIPDRRLNVSQNIHSRWRKCSKIHKKYKLHLPIIHLSLYKNLHAKSLLSYTWINKLIIR